MAESKKKANNYRRTIRLSDDVYESITQQADRRHTTPAVIIREYIEHGLSASYYNENDNKVRQMIREELDAAIGSYMDRLIKVQVKGTKAAASSLYALISLLAANFISDVSAEDLLANAFRQATSYLRQTEKTSAEYRAEAHEFLTASEKLIKKDEG